MDHPRLTFTVPGRAVAKGRPRMWVNPKTGRPVAYTPKNTADYENRVRLTAQAAIEDRGDGCYPLTGPIYLRCTFIRVVQKAKSKTFRAEALAGLHRPTQRPDVSNLVKSVEDALDGVAWVDDGQVVVSVGEKCYGEQEETIVSVSTWRPTP